MTIVRSKSNLLFARTCSLVCGCLIIRSYLKKYVDTHRYVYFVYIQLDNFYVHSTEHESLCYIDDVEKYVNIIINMCN